jgi:hypothetical protein
MGELGGVNTYRSVGKKTAVPTDGDDPGGL